MLLILVLCLIGLGAHFAMESLGSESLISSSAEPAGHFDDLFVLVSLPLFLASLIWIEAGFRPSLFQQFTCRPPLLPPPDR